MTRCNVLQQIAFAFLLLIGTVGLARAEQIEIASTLNPVGSGARATGMGGAFIGVADDATAASWNPAGLVQLEKPEFSIVYSYFRRNQVFKDYEHRSPDELVTMSETPSSMDASSLNYASVAYPFVLFNRNMIVSLNYQRLYDLNINYDLTRTTTYDPNPIWNSKSQRTVFRQNGYLYTLSPAFAAQIVPGLYVGATVNFWGSFVGDNGLTSRNRDTTTTVSNFGWTFVDKSDITRNVSFRGTNAHFGLLWNVHGPWTVGAVYKTAFDARLGMQTTRHYMSSAFDTNGNTIIGNPVFFSESKKLTLKMPESYGIGIAYRHSDAWTVALDVYQTRWSNFVLRDESDHGKEYNPRTTESISKGRLKDTTQVRLGTEYLFIRDKFVVPVRGGVFYDPEPQTGSLDDYYGVSFGTGFSSGRIAFDVSYQYRFARNVSGNLRWPGGDVHADMNQHTINASVIFYFQ